jgi:quercetin dioxygenase-like cupin family protein
MKKKAKFFTAIISGVGLIILTILGCVYGQQPGSRRTELQRHDLSVLGREAIQVRIDLPPGSKFAKHKHPGEEVIYVLEGLFEYEVDGKPPLTLKAGDVLFIPAGVIHSARNVGITNASELATYIVEKKKPLVVMVGKHK